MSALSRFGRWALGLYATAAPDDLRMTDAVILETGRTEVRAHVAIPPERARALAARQQRQHDRLSVLQQAISERELREGEPA